MTRSGVEYYLIDVVILNKKIGMEYLLHYMPQVPNKKWMNVSKAQNIPVTT